MQKHNKNYLTKEEYTARLQIFANNLATIRKHDAEATGYKIGVNKFADLSLEEFDKMMGFKPLAEGPIDDDEQDPEVQATDEEPEEHGRNLQSYPASLDWRASGAVNPVRNQGSCGSCYAFSAINSLEGLYKIKKGTLPQLSEQQIVDCSSGYGN